MADSQTHYLVIDQGGQSTRAVLFNPRGTMLTSARRQVDVSTSPDGSYVEQAPDDLVASIYAVVREVLSWPGVSTVPIKAALVTQRSSMVCWNRDTGQALSPVISWQDTRGYGLLPRFASHQQAIHSSTGLVLNAHYGATKMRWCLENLKEVQDAAAQGVLSMGPLASYCVHGLTGKFLVDPANGSRSLLMNLQTRDWDPWLLALFGIKPSFLPTIVPSHSDYGCITLEDRQIPLELVNGDQSAAFHSYGPIQQGRGYINLGTGAFVAAKLPVSIPAPEKLLRSPVFCSSSECELLCEGTVNGAGSSLAIYEKHFKLDSTRMDEWPVNLHTMPYFLNGVGGLGSPFWQSDFQSRFEGGGEDSEQQKLFAVAESIAFLLQVNLDLLVDNGIAINEILVSGGLSQNRFLCQHLAALNPVPLFAVDNPEATARGAAYQLAGFKDDWQFPPRHSIEPADSESQQLIRSRYCHWKNLMPSLTRAC